MELEDKTDAEDVLLAVLEIFLAEAELEDKFLAGEEREVFRDEAGLSVRAKENEAVF
jgi:hypothetical protein